MKILVAFDTIEQAQQAIYAVSGQQSPAPAPAFAPNVAAPAQTYAPQAPQAPVPQAPGIPQQTWTPPAAPQAPAPGFPQAGAPMPGAPMAPAPQAPVPQAPAAAPGGQITQAALVAAAQEYSKRHTPAGTKALLQQFGAKGVGDVNPAHWPQLMQMLQQ